MVGLGDLPGGTFNIGAWDTSADGSVVVGFGNSADGSEAFIWTEADGMRALQTILEDDYGLDLTDWQLLSATGVSADGAVIVGWGTNPEGRFEAWRAEIMGVVATEPGSGFPQTYALHAAYPNPFNPRAVLRYDLPTGGSVRIAVYDVLGREVAVLLEGAHPAGQHEVVFDGHGLPSGVYFVRMAAEGFAQTRTVALLR